MPIETTLTLYAFDELSDEAKETARQWWRECRDSDDLQFVVEDFERVADILGVDLKQRTVNLYGGGTRQEPDVSWSLGYSQSDFAGFDGNYAHKAGSTAAIRAYAPKDAELVRIAQELSKAQALHGYNLRAEVTYHHYYGQQVEVFHQDWREVKDAADKGIREALKDLARWLYNALRKEDEWQSEDEQVDDAITANEYTFEANGKRRDP